MDQNTEAWLKFRGNSIGASEMAIIMGVSPYKKRAVLLREKAFPFPKDETAANNDFIYAKGHKYEKKIISFIEFDLDITLPHQPTVIFSNPNYKTPIHASLDGMTDDKEIIAEAKYVGFEAFNIYKREKQPPIHYMWQIQQQLLITGAKKCIFAFCREVKNGAGMVDLEYDYFDVYPNEKMHEAILIEAQKFWDEVLEMRALGPVNKDHTELDTLVESYETNMRSMELIEASQSVLKEKIFALVGKERIERNNYTIQTVESKGRASVDYKQYLTDFNLEVPKHYFKTGEPSISQRITFKKPEAKNV